MPVDFATADRAFNGYIQNISSGGALIETREPLPVGQQVTLSFLRPKSREHVKIGGEIVRQIPNGLGVKFNACIEDIAN